LQTDKRVGEKEEIVFRLRVEKCGNIKYNNIRMTNNENDESR